MKKFIETLGLDLPDARGSLICHRGGRCARFCGEKHAKSR
jgi:hypothetical protein